MPQIIASFEHSEQIVTLDVSLDLTLDDLSAYVGAECGEELDSLIIKHNGKTLTKEQGQQTLLALGFQADDMISVVLKRFVEQQQQQQQQQQQLQPSHLAQRSTEEQTEMLRQMLLSSPPMLQQLSTLQPEIASAIYNPAQFAEIIRPLIESGLLPMGGGAPGFQQQSQQRLPGGVSPQEWDRLQRTKEDPASQRRIQELEDQDEIQQSLELAMENTPEMFASVTMLYVSLEVNGHLVKAFVDSGAQKTIISPALAEKCGLTRLIDKRFKGLAMGVGSSEIIGVIHAAQMKISTAYLPVSFSVIDAGVDMLLGLDMLRRHQASIDLKRNVLAIADVETPFLPESEIPKGFGSQPSGQVLGSSAPLSAATGGSGAATAVAAKRMDQSAASAATVPSTTPSTVSATPSASFPESSIAPLVNLGFSRPEAISALEMAGGNAEVAASFLFQ